MTTKDYREKQPLLIFLQYFKNHKKLFALDVSCAVGIAAIDLAFPLITRSALYDLLPNQMYRTFFTIMAVVVLSYVLREKNEAGQWEYRTGVTPTPEKYRYALERFPK